MMMPSKRCESREERLVLHLLISERVQLGGLFRRDEPFLSRFVRSFRQQRLLSPYDVLGAGDLLAMKHRHGACSPGPSGQVGGRTDEFKPPWCRITTAVLLAEEARRVLGRPVRNQGSSLVVKVRKHLTK